MLIDAFTFFNELDMLEFRLRVLWPLVDKFVIVEADRTFSGEAKPFYFQQNMERFEWAREKIDYHRVYVPSLSRLAKEVALPDGYDPKHPCWQIEYFQRNFISVACKDAPPEATILVGDVDEIPSRQTLDYVIRKDDIFKDGPIVLQQAMFYYNLRHLRKEVWNGTIVTDAETMMNKTPQGLRDLRNALPMAITGGGWHLSYFGDENVIRHKIESFSHQELNKDRYKDAVHIAYCIESGEDLFDRDVPIKLVDKEEFPYYFQELAPKEWW